MKPTQIFREFFESEKSSGAILIACTLVAMSIANSPFGTSFLELLHHHLLGMTIEHWINDALMTIFFLLVGLELERELYQGELASPRNAILPIAGAVGGMIVPALIHMSLNWGTPTVRGAGIPMATDIAFSLGILSLFSNRVPFALKVFLTALAIADDLGAVVVIAIFYTKTFHLGYLLSALAVFAGLCILNRYRVHKILPYLAGGIVMWLLMYQSGIHATITGILLAFALPFADGGESSPSYQLQHRLHHPVAWFVLPIFALANTSIPIESDWANGLVQTNSLGIWLGLVIGKPLGILLFAAVVIRSKLCELPNEVRWSHIAGASLLAGIGFTMSIFVSLLAFEGQEKLINSSQIAVLLGSLISGLLGGIWFWLLVPKNLVPDSIGKSLT